MPESSHPWTQIGKKKIPTIFNTFQSRIPFHPFPLLWPILHLENEDHVSRFSVDAELVPLCSPVVSAVFMFRPHKQEDGPQR